MITLLCIAISAWKLSNYQIICHKKFQEILFGLIYMKKNQTKKKKKKKERKENRGKG